MTALLNPPSVKWKEFLTPGIEIPTPWEKAKYDSMDYKWQAERRALNNKIAELKRNKADLSEIQAAENEYAKKDREHSQVVDTYLKKNLSIMEKLVHLKVLAMLQTECIDQCWIVLCFQKASKPFCTICEAHIINVIEQYGE